MVLSTAIAVTGEGCGQPEPGDDTPPPTAPASSSPAPPSTDSTAKAEKTAPAEMEESGMRIQITIGGQRFQSTLAESPAARDLVAQLPVTIDMIDHGDVEKTGPLPSPLSLAGQPEGADPDVGDLGYYAPGNDLVLYYGDQSYYPGIVVLGRLDGDAAQRISELDGPVTAIVEVQGD
ncbi:cyclophilin-like fold protein [Nocardioides kribbensis]|uniref:Cyclophilin-like fold protein n=1 Tax=Nocardioides kribbensis TaxID=305517 RepID=A0ABV1NT54_9ACTN